MTGEVRGTWCVHMPMCTREQLQSIKYQQAHSKNSELSNLQIPCFFENRLIASAFLRIRLKIRFLKISPLYNPDTQF